MEKDDFQTLLDYFPKLTPTQIEQFRQLQPLYKEWNEKINVISRKDINHLYTHHVLHSLAIAKYINFKNNTEILDLGTGGGFPGIPLAIYFPDVKFTLVDGTQKKIKVVQEVIDALKLENVVAQPMRAEIMKQRYDFVVSRAVADLTTLVNWSFPLLKKKGQNAIPNGLIALKGGGSGIKAEIKAMPRKEYTNVEHLIGYFQEEYYKEKCVIYVQGT
jgi:16S rRNA (guanine527-N7)-methyltransferase